ncbi:CU044_5270 family protein, partial [Nonomuraea sp. NN258]|uniref:CU044_5270 family protein n=1 Tax=Nonomuraea antri TaxID=2730852 RepID=UPI001569297A
MDDEIRTFADGRPAVPPYREQARARARERLIEEARGRRGFRLPRLGWQAVAAFGVTVALVGGVTVALSNQGGQSITATPGGDQSAVMAGTDFAELDPRPGQFILVESDTMYGSFAFGDEGKETRHLYRTHRKIWQSVDGAADGLLYIEGREPRPWPDGRELPASARGWQGADWSPLASCPGTLGPAARRDYAYLSTLPADPAKMREHLYRASAPSPGKDVDADQAAFTHAGDLVRETYLPKAQRDALFEAVKTIPGVQVADGVADSAGRTGVALGLPESDGTLSQLIFDPATHLVLGERATVVDPAAAQAPAGSVVALTAQLKISVVDSLPRQLPRDPKDVTCEQPRPAEPPTDESAAPTPIPDS